MLCIVGPNFSFCVARRSGISMGRIGSRKREGGKDYADEKIAMKMTVAAVYANFRTHIVDDEGIEQKDGWTCGPKSNRLMLKFERIGDMG